MELLKKTKTIKGRNIPLVIIDEFTRKVVKSGTGGAVTISRVHCGRDANVKILSPYPFVCKGCHDTISREELFSSDSNLCIYCYNEAQAIKKNKCLECGGKDPKKDLWGVCKKCWTKKLEEEEIEILKKQEDKEE